MPPCGGRRHDRPVALPWRSRPGPGAAGQSGVAPHRRWIWLETSSRVLSVLPSGRYVAERACVLDSARWLGTSQNQWYRVLSITIIYHQMRRTDDLLRRWGGGSASQRAGRYNRRMAKRVTLLPVQPTPLIGREDDLVAAAALLRR